MTYSRFSAAARGEVTGEGAPARRFRHLAASATAAVVAGVLFAFAAAGAGVLFAFATAAVVAGGGVLAPSPAAPPECRYESTAPLVGGVQPAILIDATCADPDFNAGNFVVEEVTPKLLLPAPYAQIPYTRVRVRFNATRTDAQLSALGYTAGGPQTVNQPATFYFPAAANFQNRFFQHLYPLPQSKSPTPEQLQPNTASDINFALASGGYFIDSEPGNPLVGYRVDAAFAKMARAYAQQLYGNTGRIYGYIWGGSGGSFQVEGALEKTTGVWDGAVPYVIALSGLTSSGGMMGRLYDLRVPAAKRAGIAGAVQVGSGLDPFSGLTADERGGLLEFMRFGFPLPYIGNSGGGLILFDEGRLLDPTYEEDFWTKPGYAGKDLPAYVRAAAVDTFVTITARSTDAEGRIVLTLDGVPTLGTSGNAGMEHYVYLADGTTRVKGTTEAASLLAGTRDDTARTFTVNAKNDPALVAALEVGAKLRINNRYHIAVAHYVRHTVPANGVNVQYDQYRNPNGTPIYPQRAVNATEPGGTRTSGGVVASGHIRFKTIAVTNQADNLAFHLTGHAYATMVERALGRAGAADMFRIYQQESADHFDNPTISPSNSPRLVTYVPVLYQAMRDLSAWVEKGVEPPASTRYDVVDGQVRLAERAEGRRGIQPVVTLTVNGGTRATVSVNQPVTFAATIEVPPQTGQVVGYDWYLGGTPIAYEAPTMLDQPLPLVKLQRTVTFPTPGTYLVSLRVQSQRNGSRTESATTLENLDRVRVVVQ